jgi:hypothetical protein
MNARMLLLLSMQLLACAHPRPHQLSPLPVAKLDIKVIDARLREDAPWGRFEDLYSADIENLVAGSLPALLQRLDGQLRLTLLDLRWSWRNGPFFLAEVSGVARIQLERRPRPDGCWCRTIEGAATRTSTVQTGSSLDTARRLMLEALAGAFEELERKATGEPCPEQDARLSRVQGL